MSERKHHTDAETAASHAHHDGEEFEDEDQQDDDDEDTGPVDAVKRADTVVDEWQPGSDGKEHLLATAWTFWFNRRLQGASRSKDSYERNIKRVAAFDTVTRFWQVYNHMIRPNDLPNSSDYHLFRQGIRPLWEDEQNKRGGKWIVRLKKGLASRCWEELVCLLQCLFGVFHFHFTCTTKCFDIGLPCVYI